MFGGLHLESHDSQSRHSSNSKKRPGDAGRIKQACGDQPLFRRPAEMPLIDMCKPLRVASSSTPPR